MRRETKVLLAKALDSLALGVELFNRPSDRARVSGTLIQLDHSLEMLMKAAILHRGGRIRDKGSSETIGFEACVRRSLSEAKVQYLSNEQAVALRSLNALRDAEQHYYLRISEAHLYIQVQSAFTVFRHILKAVFKQELLQHLPTRVLPVSTTPPLDLAAIFASEVREVRKLLAPGRRQRSHALARLRALAILDRTLGGDNGQPSERSLLREGDAIRGGTPWNEIYQSAASLDSSVELEGTKLFMQVSKKQGIPVNLVSEDHPDAAVIALKRVNELGYYNLSATKLAAKVGLTVPKMNAVVRHVRLRENREYFQTFQFGKSAHPRYSQRAIQRLRDALEKDSIEEIWKADQARRKLSSGHGRGRPIH